MSILAGVKTALNKVQSGESINDLPSSALSEILNKQNGKLDDATGVIVELMHFGENERTRLDAAREVLNLHGARKEETHQDNRIQIVVHNLEGSDNMHKIANIFNPDRKILDLEPEPAQIGQ